jgi:TolB-like protein
MENKKYGIITLFFFIWIIFTGSVYAGQVVTEELSQWARHALANEQTLSLVPSSRSVAVLYYQNLTGNASFNPLQKGLAVMLTTDLAKVKDLKVVERARLQAVLEEIELGATGLVDTDTAPKVGRLLGARFLSGGDILKGNVTQLQVSPNLLDVSDQILFNQAEAEGDLNDLIAIEKEILFEIIRLMDVVLTPDQKAELEKPISTSIPALMLLFMGIDASDHGNYSQAADLYEQALSKDPNLTTAKEALNEINTLELTSQSADTAATEQAAGAKDAVAAPKKSGGLLKWTAVGLGVVAVGAGGYFVATELNNDDEKDEEELPPEPPVDTTPPTVTRTNPRSGTDIECESGNIEFHFSEAMIPFSGSPSVDIDSWNITSLRWTDNDQTLIVEWENDSSVCFTEGESTPIPISGPVTFELIGFTDLEGIALGGETRFTFNIP